MRKLWSAAGAAAAWLGVAQAATAVDVGQALTGLSVKGYKSGELTPEALQGKVTVVNFWATWCAACKVELVEMEELLKPHLGEPDFQAAFVSLDKDPAKAAEWFQSHLKQPEPFLARLFVDPKFETADKLSVDAFPMTLVIGRDGKVVHLQRGFKEGQGSTQELAKLTAELLKTGRKGE
jgi:thiol-disulfide isomerase/thioredoxin